jgi:hypothetical protein
MRYYIRSTLSASLSRLSGSSSPTQVSNECCLCHHCYVKLLFQQIALLILFLNIFNFEVSLAILCWSVGGCVLVANKFRTRMRILSLLKLNLVVGSLPFSFWCASSLMHFVFCRRNIPSRCVWAEMALWYDLG